MICSVLSWKKIHFPIIKISLLIYLDMPLINSSNFWCYWLLTWNQSQRLRVQNPWEACYFHLFVWSIPFYLLIARDFGATDVTPICLFVLLYIGFQIRTTSHSRGALIYIVMPVTNSASVPCYWLLTILSSGYILKNKKALQWEGLTVQSTLRSKAVPAHVV